ncbi:MAG TPA: hypothetical protein PKY85_07355 [Nitrosomonas sp.]|nr:hypothetical protein [Nitrosomonas sp.]
MRWTIIYDLKQIGNRIDVNRTTIEKIIIMNNEETPEKPGVETR